MAGSRPGGGWCCLPVVILIGFSHPKARYFDSDLSSLPLSLLRSKARGSPSVANPLTSPCGSPAATIFTTGVPPPYDGFLSLHAQRKEPKERVPRTLRPKNRGSLARRSAQMVRPRHFLRARLPCFARKPGAHRPWCARSPGRGFTGSPPIIRLAPVPGANAGVLAPPLRAWTSLFLLPRLE
jgi:hypothetical protein